MKSPTIIIKQITSTETLPIRHKVMWPDKPLTYVMLPNDELGRHYGLFVNEKMTAIISLFITNNEAQFRKFATLNEFQGLGYGTKLLHSIIELLKEEGVKKLWCNARVEKTKFYEKFNFKTTNKVYEKGGIEFVSVEREFK